MAGLSGRIRALAWLRWRLAVNGLRTGAGISSAVLGVLAALLGVVLSVGLAAAAAAVLVLAGRNGGARPFVLHASVLAVLGLFAFLLPLLFGEARLELAPRRFLIFPVEVKELFWIGVGLSFVSGANLLLYPAVLTVTVVGCLTPGVNGPGLAAGVFGMVAATVVWQQLVIAGIRSLMAHRRAREILAVLGISLAIVTSFVPQLLVHPASNGAHRAARPAPTSSRAVSAAVAVIQVLPPVLAARAGESGSWWSASAALLGLAAWAALGLWLDWRVFLRQLWRDESGTARGGGTRIGRSRAAGILDLLPQEVAGAAGKQLRYLFRSTPGRIVLVTAPLMGLFLGVMLRRVGHGFAGFSVGELGFVLVCFVSATFIGNFSYNLFMWDGEGAALYFLAPAPMGRVLLGLSLGLWVFEAVILAEVLAIWLLLSGPPPAFLLFLGMGLTAGMTLASTGVGLVVSILFPLPRDIGATRNQPAMVAGLVSLLAMPVMLAFLGLGPGLVLVAGHPWAAVGVQCGAVAATAMAYRLALAAASRLALRRREALLGALKP